MLNLNHLPPYYGPRMQTRMRERSQKYAWRGTSLDIRTYGRALALSRRGPIGVQAEPALVSDANVKGGGISGGAEVLLLLFR